MAINRSELWRRWFRQAEEAAGQLGFTTYNHQAEIAERLQGRRLTINKVDGHPSAAVNQIYGEKLYQAILQKLPTQR